jgi:hypothetical protein
MVKIVTEDGRNLEFAIVDIDTVAIIGEEEQYTAIDVNLSQLRIQRIVVPFSEIIKLEKRQTRTGATISLVLGVLVMGFGILLLKDY